MEVPPLALPIPSQPLSQIPSSLRRCLHLLQTCHADLQDLIHLRSTSHQLLSTDPTHAHRIDAVISDAQRSLVDICCLVPGSGLRNRLAWMMVDSRLFASHEGLIAAQHRRVVGEIGGLRGVVALGRLVGGGDGEGDGEGLRMDWDNVGLLEEMLDGKGRVVNRAVGYRLPPLPDLPPSYDFKYFGTGGGEMGTGASEMAGVSRLGLVDGSSSGLIQVETAMATMSDASSGLIKVDTPTGDDWSGLIKVESPTKTAPDIDGMDLLFGNKVEAATKTVPDIDGFDLLFGNLNLDISTGLVTLPPSQSYQSRPSFQHHRPPSELDASPFTPPSRNSTPIPELQSQTHYRHASLPLSLPSQQPSGPSSPPPIKPLSTIPQELIHRYDGYQSPQSPPPPRPVLPSTTSQPTYPYRDRASTSPAPWHPAIQHERSYSAYSPYREHQPSSPPPKQNDQSSLTSLTTQHNQSQSLIADPVVYELPGGQVFYPNMRSGTPSTGWKLLGQGDGD